MRKIRFCKHAETKFKILAEHGFPISKQQIIDTLKDPDKREKGGKNRIISQKVIDNEHVLRVVHEKSNNKIIVITFYPGRRKYYEN